MKYVVMFSGGAGSWAAAKRVAARHGTDDLMLLFADTKIEDDDLYRFIEDAADDVGAPLVKVAEGRDPWRVFFDERFLGNSRVDPCSKILKRRFLRRWLEARFDPTDTTIALGIDISEVHRFERARAFWQPWAVTAPLCEEPFVDRHQVQVDLLNAGLKPPRLYALGFAHNNCGGFCVKAGQAHFARLLEAMPERYAYHEQREEEFRVFIGRDVSILKRVVNGVTERLTMRQFREERERGEEFDRLDFGACGCFSGEEEQQSLDLLPVLR